MSRLTEAQKEYFSEANCSIKKVQMAFEEAFKVAHLMHVGVFTNLNAPISIHSIVFVKDIDQHSQEPIVL